MPALLVGKITDLPVGRMAEITAGDGLILVCRTGDGLFAIDGTCPHRGGPLGAGALHGNMVVCPFHAWEFDCITGVCDMNAAIVQKRYAVCVEAGDILVETEPRA